MRAAVLILALLAAGCGDSAPKTPTKAEIFDKLQQGAGLISTSKDDLEKAAGAKILIDSSKERSPGDVQHKIRFVARDGYVSATAVEEERKSADGGATIHKFNVLTDSLKIE